MSSLKSSIRSAVAVAALAVSLLAVLAPVGSAGAAVGNCVPDPSWGVPDPSFASQVVTLVNQHRQSLGLSTLGISPTLSAAAVWKSRHMAFYGYLQHDDPAPPVARTVSDRLAACGYPIGSVGWGENIAYGYATPQAVVTAWLNSPGHRANIEAASYRATGVGAVRAANGLYFWTQDFGTYLDAGGATQPSAPTVAISSAPPLSTTSTTASFAWSSTGAPTSTTCSLDGGAVAGCASPRTYSGLGQGAHRFVVTVANSAGSSSATYSWTVAAPSPGPAAPTVSLTSVPPATGTSTAATLAWTTSGAPTSVTCTLDAGQTVACSSPWSYTGLSTGTHTFTVRVANSAGAGAASTSWTVSPSTATGAPTVSFTSGPAAATTSTIAVFTFAASGATGLTCSLDGAPAAPCASPRSYVGLTVGAHRFVVTATNGAGSSSAAYGWTVTG